MAVRTEELQLRVLIDGSPARRELAQLDQEYAKINSELTGVKKNTAEWVASTARLDEIRARQVELRKEIGLTGLTAKQLSDELRRLQAANRNLTPNTEQWTENAVRIDQIKQRLKELNSVAEASQVAWNTQARAVKLADMTMAQLEMEAKRLRTAMRDLNPNTAQFAALRTELARVEDRMATVRSGLSSFGRAWQGMKSQVVGTFAGVGALFGISAITGAVRSWVTGAAQMSDAMSDVRRTTGLTENQMQSLNSSLKGLDTRTPRAELLALASDAGKLGISAERDVLGFVRAGDQIKVALGEDLGEDAIKVIGKLTQTFRLGEQRGYDLEKSLLSAGSAINTLGQSSTAAESYLVDYATRMAGVNVQTGISIENTLGYAAAADQLGLKVETTTTAMSQFTLKAFKEPAVYAQIAGMKVGDFNKLLKEDTNEALLRVLEGLNGNNAGMETMVQKFGDMGQEGARAVSTLAALSGQTKLVREQQDIANKSFAEATSITTEFQTRNNNFAGNLEKIGKALRGWFVNSSVVKGFQDLTSAVVEWIRVPVSEKMEEERLAMMKTEAQILSYNVGNQERTRLIKELQAQYPGFLTNINAETVSQDQLRVAVGKLNQELVNKIILQKQDEKIQAQIKEQAERKQKTLEQEDNVRERMVKMAEKYNLTIKDGVPLMEQARSVLAQIEAIRQKSGKEGLGVAVDPVARFGHAINELRISYAFLNTEQERSNQLAQEREALMERLGISTDPGTTPAAAPTEASTAPTDPTADADATATAKHDATIKAMEQLRADLAKIRRDMELDGLSADEREIAELDDKFAAIRQKTLENAAHTQQDLDELEKTYEDARAELLTQQAAERERKAVEAKQRAMSAVQQAEDERWEDQLPEEDAEIVHQLQRMETLVALYEKAGLDTQDIVRQTEEAVAAIREGYRKKEEQKAIDDFKKRIAEQVKVYQAVGAAVGGINDFLAATYSAQTDSNYRNTVAAKALGLAQIAINSGVGVANAIKSGAGVPFPANLAAIATGVGAVLSGIASAINLLSAANVTKPGDSAASTPAPPALQNVPLGERGGIFEGPSHAQGGLAVVDRRTGRVAAEVEGGEPWMVLSNAFRRNNPGLVPRLLHASATGGKLAATGGIFTPAPAFNFAAATESMRLVQLAQGGLLGAAAATTQRVDDTGAEMLGLLRAIAAGIASVDDGVRTQPERITAEVSLQDLNRRQAELASLQSLNRVRR